MRSFTWQAPEYFHKPRSSDWFWVLGIIATSIIITSIIFGNILFAIIVFIGSFIVALFASRKPGTLYVEINEKGIILEKEKYPYRLLESFWINDEEGDLSKLIIKTQKYISPYVIIVMPDEYIDEVREFLKEKIKEEYYEEHPFFKILENLGF